MDDPSNSQEHKEDTAQNNAPIVPGTGEEHPPDASKKTGHCYQHREKKKKKWSDLELHDKAIIELTLGLLLITGVTAFVLVRQANIFEKQLEEMKSTGFQTERLIMLNIGQLTNAAKSTVAAQEQASAAQDSAKAIQRQTRQDQRAWMHFTEIKITVSRDPQGRADITAPLGMFATGKTPATKIRLDFVIAIVKNEREGIAGFPYAYIPRVQDTTGIINPGDPQPTFIAHLMKRIQGSELAEIRLLSVDEYQSLMDGKTFVILYGKIRYRDIFKIPHDTRYCHFFSPSGKDVYAQRCTEYNGVDDNG